MTYETGELTITKAKFTVTGQGYSGTYDGESHAASATASVTEGTTIEYKVGEGEWTTAAPSIKDVGEQQVQIRATNPNYEDATDNVVLKVEVTLTVDNKSKTYGDADPELTATVEGLVEGDTLEYKLQREPGENVGEYAIHVDIGEIQTKTAMNASFYLMYIGPAPTTTSEIKGNYDITVKEGTLTIDPATVTVTVNDASKQSGQNDPAFTATITGLKNGDSADVIKYTITREPGDKPGTYVITVTGEANQGNYIVKFVAGKFTITEAPTPAPDKSVIPDTSDHNNTGGWMAMLFVSMLTGMLGVFFRKKYA